MEIVNCIMQKHHSPKPWSKEWNKCEYCGTLTDVDKVIERLSFEEWMSLEKRSPDDWLNQSQYLYEEFGWDLSIIKKRGSFYARIETISGVILYDSYMLDDDYDLCQKKLINQAFHIINKDKL